ncbi:hypothetical protein ACFP2T_12810 [Plantactinospora solaniradicis]|uniref:Uncharacterized protein n=1 Tax=Plantactinospora solaniradicis TaxID=1723736 RepID=A0ABW1K5Q8_9ACTN
MASKAAVLRLVGLGRSYQEIGATLGIPPGQAYLIGTGIPADGGGTVTRAQRERPGILPSRTQRLVNPREAPPPPAEPVHEWMRSRAHGDQLTRPGR